MRTRRPRDGETLRLKCLRFLGLRECSSHAVASERQGSVRGYLTHIPRGEFLGTAAVELFG